jgi:hypothetical protein
MASVVTIIIEPNCKFVRRNYASLVNIDVGTLLKIAQQKTVKKYSKIFFISDLPTLIFLRYETGTTGFFRPIEENYTVCSWGQTVSTLGKPTVNERWHSSHNIDALKTVQYFNMLYKYHN